MLSVGSRNEEVRESSSQDGARKIDSDPDLAQKGVPCLYSTFLPQKKSQNPTIGSVQQLPKSSGVVDQRALGRQMYPARQLLLALSRVVRPMSFSTSSSSPVAVSFTLELGTMVSVSLQTSAVDTRPRPLAFDVAHFRKLSFVNKDRHVDFFI